MAEHGNELLPQLRPFAFARKIGLGKVASLQKVVLVSSPVALTNAIRMNGGLPVLSRPSRAFAIVGSGSPAAVIISIANSVEKSPAFAQFQNRSDPPC
jgi:hypothetical protein